MRYLVSGYYGEGNLGDEAILAAMLRDLRRHDPAAEVTVLSFDPADTARRHGVEAISTSLRHPSRLVAAMRHAPTWSSAAGAVFCTKPTSPCTDARSGGGKAGCGRSRTSSRW